jgi:starvation-inducible DNA-binding protein
MVKNSKEPEHFFAPAGMSVDDAKKVTAILQTRLSSLIDLSLILKHIHWNVVGPGFIAVHLMMDEQTESARALVDEVAERITALGGIAAGLAGQVSELRDADGEYPLGRAPVMAHLGALDKVYQRVGADHRAAIAELEKLDAVSTDLITGQTGTLDMNHWFVRAHLENTAGHLSTSDSEDELDAASAAVLAPEPGEEVADLQKV